MPAVNWDQPSTGLVSDPNHSLVLANDVGPALAAKAEGVAIEAISKADSALVAATRKTVTAKITSDESVAALCRAPKSSALIGSNEAAAIAVAGVNLPDPAQPQDSPGGIGVAGLSARFAAFGVVGATFGPRSTGVWGDARGGGVGVRGTGPNGGVQGQSSGADGVSGSTQSERASGVYGYAPGTQGAGVTGRSLGGAGVDGGATAGPGVRGSSEQAQGVTGLSQGNNAAGVAGRNDLASGVGVDGYSQNGTAVRAIASKGTALLADSFSGIGVDASNFSTSQPTIKSFSSLSVALDAGSAYTGVKAIGLIRTGVSGSTIAGLKAGEPETGCGVFGHSLLGAGVCGITLAGTGVLGIGPPVAGAWAGRFQGNVHIDGMLFKSASLFSIDHPLQPKTKVLNHACVEAAEYKTFYDGTVLLGAGGKAVVKLPRWFDALNHELRYQLTALGGPAPDLHVAREFEDGSFAIAGGRPRQKVCWQVTAVRRDTWAKANPLVVEQPRAQARAAAPTLSTADIERLAKQTKAQAEQIQTRAREDAVERKRAGKAGQVARADKPAKLVINPAVAVDEWPLAAAKAVLKLAQGDRARK
jgi:hypothetical protein